MFLGVLESEFSEKAGLSAAEGWNEWTTDSPREVQGPRQLAQLGAERLRAIGQPETGGSGLEEKGPRRGEERPKSSAKALDVRAGARQPSAKC